VILAKDVVLFDISSLLQKQFAKIIDSKKKLLIFIEFLYLLCSYSIFRRVFLPAFQGKVVFLILFHNFLKTLRILWILARFPIPSKIVQFYLLFLFSFIRFMLFFLVFLKFNIHSPFFPETVYLLVHFDSKI